MRLSIWIWKSHKEESSSSGVRRIKAVLGWEIYHLFLIIDDYYYFETSTTDFNFSINIILKGGRVGYSDEFTSNYFSYQILSNPYLFLSSSSLSDSNELNCPLFLIMFLIVFKSLASLYSYKFPSSEIPSEAGITSGCE